MFFLGAMLHPSTINIGPVVLFFKPDDKQKKTNQAVNIPSLAGGNKEHRHGIVFRGLMGVRIHLKEVINTYKNTLSIHFRNKHLNELFC